MPADVVLGADLGTSGLKLVALDDDGSVVGAAEAGYAVDRPTPDRAEIDVETWLRAFDDALQRLTSSLPGVAVRGLGLAGQMHGAVLVDGAGTPLRPALLWPDSRATAELDAWRSLPLADRAALANPVVPGMTGPLLAWLARHERDVVDRAAAVLLPKDAFRVSLVGGGPLVTDRSDASATLLWDVAADDWSAAAVGAAGVRRDLLPGVRPSAEIVGTAVLPVGPVPVVVGGADTALALLAAGTTTGVQLNLGTGAQLLRPGWAARPVEAPLIHTYADVRGGWYAMAALQNGGSAWTWAGAVLGLTEAEFFDAASAAPAGAGGVVFRPFLTRERGGAGGAEEPAGWTGMHPGTTRADLARAAVEGVAFAVAAAFDLLGPVDPNVPVILTGGGARPRVVRQLLADVLGRPMRYLPLRSASAVGAALLAARGTGRDVVARRPAGELWEPQCSGALRAAAERWTGRPPGSATG